jgi:hypothetical protein
LGSAVTIFQGEAHDAGPRFLGRETANTGQDVVEKIGFDCDIGIEEQDPAATTEPAAGVDGASETAIAAEAPDQNARCAPKTSGMRR